MEKLLEQFAKIPLQQKLIGVGAAVVLIAVATYFWSVAPALELIADNDARIEKQDAQLLKLQQQAQHRTQFMREVERLKQRLREAEEQLPKQAEIPKLLRDIAYEAQQSGLRVDRFEVQSETQEGDFARVPVKMSVRGGYHEIAVFFDRLAKMPRIVNVTDLMMTKPELENKKIVVSSSYTATTYRFLDKAPEPAGGEGPKKPKKKADEPSDDAG
ncbi:MAG: type 4a pilus biogenesis protein PilO [Deltaproteobacteria bacterium]|nr:type 4a pilus biogenesis protein PilO [Deltaproteobacteria bacterium]